MVQIPGSGLKVGENPGGCPGGGCWCLELTDALLGPGALPRLPYSGQGVFRDPPQRFLSITLRAFELILRNLVTFPKI